AASSVGRARTRLVFVPRPCGAEALTARFDHIRIPRCHECERRTIMRKTALWSAALLASTLTFVPTAPCFARSLQKDVDQAAVIIDRFRNMPEQGIPDAVLRD